MGHKSCQGAPTARILRIMHTAPCLPSVAAEQRERSQARRRPYGAAACLGTAEQDAGGFLSGGWRCRRSAWRCGGGVPSADGKAASAKRRLRVSDASNFAESREPAFAGRVLGGAAARRRLSSGPTERGLLAACAKGCFGFSQAMPPTSKTRRSRARARSLQHSAR